MYNVSPQIFPTDFLALNVYFETLNIKTQTTSNAYSFIALLSDIGGQLGLFLGVSVISIMEFGTWIVDEIKDRVFGIGPEEKLKEKFCACCKHHSQKKPVPVDLEALENNELEGSH